jgi:hypothetical protein
MSEGVLDQHSKPTMICTPASSEVEHVNLVKYDVKEVVDYLVEKFKLDRTLATFIVLAYVDEISGLTRVCSPSLAYRVRSILETHKDVVEELKKITVFKEA